MQKAAPTATKVNGFEAKNRALCLPADFREVDSLDSMEKPEESNGFDRGPVARSQLKWTAPKFWHNTIVLTHNDQKA
jgi:hypothetical protein